jgi:NADP-dependent 3-hydroxy acid dehydrogenase YdfG
LRIVQLDVNSDSSVNLGVKTVLKEQNRVDLLVNNLGTYILFSMDEMKAQFETNFYGTVRTAQAVLPVMRKHTSGIIINSVL